MSHRADNRAEQEDSSDEIRYSADDENNLNLLDSSVGDSSSDERAVAEVDPESGIRFVYRANPSASGTKAPSMFKASSTNSEHHAHRVAGETKLS